MEDGLNEKLSQHVQWVESADEGHDDARILSQRDRDYVDGNQLTAEEISVLKARGQPPIIINRVKRKIDYLLGYERKLRTDPRALPRTPQHEQDAEAATDALRFVVDKAHFEETASSAWENGLVEGFGGCILGIRQAKDGRIDITTEHVPWDRIIYDPHSRRRDFTDAKYLGLVIWSDLDDAKEQYPGAIETLDAAMLGDWSASANQTTDDRPYWKTWSDTTRKRVKLVELHWREGKRWMRATFCRSGYIVPPEESPFKDEEGDPFCPLMLFSAYINRENQRYGTVRDMIGPQDEINKRRSKALHLLSVRQIVADEGAVKDQDKARREMAKPDGYIEVAPGMRFELQQTGDMAAAQFQLLQESKAEIDLMGPNAALQGKADGVQSGRAIIAQQTGGAVEMEMLFGNYKAWKRRVYRGMWNMVRQFWTGETWVRVTDNENNLRWVGLNTPPRVEQDENGQPVVIPPGPNVASLDVDIILDESPDVATLAGEQFEQLAQLAAVVPIPPEILIEASSLRNKKELLERLNKGPTPEQRAAQQIQLQGEAAKVAKAQAEAEKTTTDAAKGELELQQMAMMQASFIG